MEALNHVGTHGLFPLKALRRMKKTQADVSQCCTTEYWVFLQSEKFFFIFHKIIPYPVLWEIFLFKYSCCCCTTFGLAKCKAISYNLNYRLEETETYLVDCNSRIYLRCMSEWKEPTFMSEARSRTKGFVYQSKLKSGKTPKDRFLLHT